MSLTPKDAAGEAVVYPAAVHHSCLVESVTDSPECPDNVTIALGFKPTNPTTPPLMDVTGHYPLTIQKEGTTARLYKGLTKIGEMTIDMVENTMFFLTGRVLATYSGTAAGYWSNLWVVEGIVGPERFWKPSGAVTGLIVPVKPATSDLNVLCRLDFSDGANLGYSEEV